MKVFAVLTCNPASFVYQSLGLVSENRLLSPIIEFFGYPLSSAVTSCKFAMLAEEVCVYTSVKFDMRSVFASLRASVRFRWSPNIDDLLYLHCPCIHVHILKTISSYMSSSNNEWSCCSCISLCTCSSYKSNSCSSFV